MVHKDTKINLYSMENDGKLDTSLINDYLSLNKVGDVLKDDKERFSILDLLKKPQTRLDHLMNTVKAVQFFFPRLEVESLTLKYQELVVRDIYNGHGATELLDDLRGDSEGSRFVNVMTDGTHHGRLPIARSPSPWTTHPPITSKPEPMAEGISGDISQDPEINHLVEEWVGISKVPASRQASPSSKPANRSTRDYSPPPKEKGVKGWLAEKTANRDRVLQQAYENYNAKRESQMLVEQDSQSSQESRQDPIIPAVIQAPPKSTQQPQLRGPYDKTIAQSDLQRPSKPKELPKFEKPPAAPPRPVRQSFRQATTTRRNLSKASTVSGRQQTPRPFSKQEPDPPRRLEQPLQPRSWFGRIKDNLDRQIKQDYNNRDGRSDEK